MPRLLVSVLCAGALIAGGCAREQREVQYSDSSSAESRVPADSSRAEDVGDSMRGDELGSSASPDTLQALRSFTQGPRLLPIDEASRDKSFARFRDTMRRIARERDVTSLLAHVSPKIRSSFGASNGLTAFKRHWQLEAMGARSAFWPIFSRLLEMGGSWGKHDSATFWAPYVYSSWPEQPAIEPYDHAAVIAKNTTLRERPDSNSKAIAMLSYNIVRTLDNAHMREPRTSKWVRVQLADSTRGYLPVEDVWSQLYYRAGFSKEANAWKMTVFIAGD